MGTLPLLPQIFEPFKNHQHIYHFIGKIRGFFKSKAIYSYQISGIQILEDSSNYAENDNCDPFCDLWLAHPVPIWV